MHSYFPQFIVLYWRLEGITSEREFSNFYPVSNFENVISVVVKKCFLEKARGFKEKMWVSGTFKGMDQGKPFCQGNKMTSGFLSSKYLSQDTRMPVATCNKFLWVF